MSDKRSNLAEVVRNARRVDKEGSSSPVCPYCHRVGSSGSPADTYESICCFCGERFLIEVRKKYVTSKIAGSQPAAKYRMQGKIVVTLLDGNEHTFDIETFRVYSPDILARAIEECQDRVNDRHFLGEAVDSRGRNHDFTRLSDVSHLITHVDVDGTGMITAHAQLTQSPNGIAINNAIVAGEQVKCARDIVGTLRGHGSSETIDGREVIGDDYRLIAIDLWMRD